MRRNEMTHSNNVSVTQLRIVANIIISDKECFKKCDAFDERRKTSYTSSPTRDLLQLQANIVVFISFKKLYKPPTGRIRIPVNFLEFCIHFRFLDFQIFFFLFEFENMKQNAWSQNSLFYCLILQPQFQWSWDVVLNINKNRVQWFSNYVQPKFNWIHYKDKIFNVQTD